jgi:hypothetical protein
MAVSVAQVAQSPAAQLIDATLVLLFQIHSV